MTLEDLFELFVCLDGEDDLEVVSKVEVRHVWLNDASGRMFIRVAFEDNEREGGSFTHEPRVDPSGED